MQLIITRHAEQRIRKRLGVKRKAVEKIAIDAYTNGKSHSECKGNLKRYLDGQFLKEYKATNMRVQNQMLYIFNDNTLITVLLLPDNLR